MTLVGLGGVRGGESGGSRDRVLSLPCKNILYVTDSKPIGLGTKIQQNIVYTVHVIKPLMSFPAISLSPCCQTN